MATRIVGIKKVQTGKYYDEREKKLNESEVHWQNEIKLKKVYIADLWRKIEDPFTSEEDKKYLRGQVQYNEECIQRCKWAMQNIQAQKKLLAMEREAPVQEAIHPPSRMATTASPTKSEFTSDGTDSLRQYEKSVQQGIVELQSAESVIVGVAGSGKTRSLAMALDQDLPVKRVSTPCAKAPVRTVVQNKIGMKDGELNQMEDDVYFVTVIHTAKELAFSLPRGYSPRPTIGRWKSDTPNYMRKLEEEMIRCVYDETHSYNLLYDLHWNRLTDSGGQPQFLEVLPIFVHHISLGIFTIKLNERLDHHPTIEYYSEEGKALGRPYRSWYSHEQIIRQWMRALISQGRGKGKLRFLFLGTHRDMMDDSIGESLQEKNTKLLKIVRSFKMQDNVIYSNQGCKDIIFAINAKTPGPEDWEVMRHVRKAIVESSDVPPISIPIKWFALELALLHFVKETKQSVLQESTCYDMVAHFHFDHANFKAALSHLHQAKLIFYFEKVGLIVANIQMILDKLSEVVRYNIKLRTNPNRHAALDGMWMKFCRYGILNVRCLEKFPKHYIEGVFSPNELLQLFVHLRIVSELRSNEFLMPCLLPVEEESNCNPEPKTQAVPAMAVEFPDGGPMLGTFCGLVCHLLSAKKWELVTDESNEPCHLTRSSIHFSAPRGLPGKVTINDPLSSFFLVTYHGPLDVATKVCPLIRETILAGIEEVFKTLNYSSREEDTESSSGNPLAIMPSITFLCSCGNTPLHAATMSANGEYLKCPYNSQYYERVTAKHEIWLADDVRMAKAKKTFHGDNGSTTVPLSLKALILLKWKDEQGHTHTFRLIRRVSARWVEFGTLLGLTSNQLDVLKQDYPGNVTFCWRKVMDCWLNGGQDEYPATWEGLYRLLEDTEYAEVAEELKRAVARSFVDVRTSPPNPEVTRKRSLCYFL